jgi:hypothetical protein
MKAILIPCRTYHFCVPQLLVMKILRIVTDNEINYSIGGVSQDEQFLSLRASINLNKSYQRNVIREVEILLSGEKK